VYTVQQEQGNVLIHCADLLLSMSATEYCIQVIIMSGYCCTNIQVS